MSMIDYPCADMAQVIQTFLPAYRQRYQLSPQQASVCQSIVQCQTEVMGGEYQQCTSCGYEQRLYHSCGNRHCPQCKQSASEQWEEKQLAALLPVRYYHLVFTMPHEFNAWCQLHPKTMYSLLFRAVWQTLSRFSRRHKRLQGQLGVTCVLHTWGQNLQHHVHLHCLIPGLALNSEQDVIEMTKSHYLYPVNALKKVFRGKLVSLLRASYKHGELLRITRDNEVNNVLDEVMSKRWSIYIKPYLKHPETVVKYLSRYTYRIAISNHRIIKVDEQSVSFGWKDYVDNGRKKVMKLDGVEFLRRFLMHVLPSGFMRIRHFGFLANCVRQKRVLLLRDRLKEMGIQLKLTPVKKAFDTDRVFCLCPHCHQSTMRSLYTIASFKERRQALVA
ncbi:MAG: IS91 family transposase [Gammaproteobacteria bacterium]|nr:IS91 family transposase [Gammaproteobacteria bacterium]